MGLSPRLPLGAGTHAVGASSSGRALASALVRAMAPIAVGLAFVAAYAVSAVIFTGGSPPAGTVAGTNLDLYGGPAWLHGLMRWDGGWYALIAQRGYHPLPGAAQPFAFFPLFPAAVAIVHAAAPVLSIAASGFAVNVAAILAAVTLTDRSLGDWSMRDRLLAIAAVLAVPSAFFDVAFYSEGLFLLASALVVWATSRSERLASAPIGVVLATLDRPLGLLLLVIVLAALVRDTRPLRLRVAIAAASCAGAVTVPIVYLIVSGDPLIFISAQGAWTSLRLLGGDAFRWVIVQLNPATTTNPVICFSYWEVLLAGVPLLVALRKRNAPVAVYGALALATAAVSGGVGTQSRYLASLLPLWLAGIALLRRSRPNTWMPVVAALAVAGFASNVWLISRFASWRWGG